MSDTPEGRDVLVEEPSTPSGPSGERSVPPGPDGVLPEASPAPLPSNDATGPAAMRDPGARRRLVGIGAVLFVAFLATVVMRSPWRGFLADGDSYVTAQALRWLRTWHRDGALASSFALVVSPPTEEYEGDNRLTKWALPGHPILVHYALEALGAEPTLVRIMQANLAIHLALALLLAFLAYYLAALAKPESLRWPILVALHCGLFSLLFPPILFWGQNLSCQYFTVLPLLLIAVAGRRLRDSFPTERGRRAVDRAVGISVFAGTFTDFLFWLLVPYFLAARALRSWRGLAPTSEPWKRTLRRPYLAALLVLMFLFLVNGHIGIMIHRALTWTFGTQGGGLGFFLATRVWFLVAYFAGHFYDAFGILGFFCIGLALSRLVRRRKSAGIPEAARGILLDLLLPGLLFTFVLSPHQSVHTVAAMQYVPYIALAWTFLTPIAVAGIHNRWMRTAAWTAYGAFAFVSIWPSQSGYRRYFPEPRLDWTLEARFLRENTQPSDRIFSPATEIEILPPADRACGASRPSRVRTSRHPEADGGARGWGGVRPLRAGGGPASPGNGTNGGAPAPRRKPCPPFPPPLPPLDRRARRCRLSRPRGRDPEGRDAPPDEALAPFDGELRRPELPVAFHLRYGPGAGQGEETLYWKDETHFHSVSPDGERVVRGEEAFSREYFGIWQKLDAVDGNAAELGAFLLRVFEGRGESAAERFLWADYEVIRRAVGPGPAALQKRSSPVGGWDAYLVYAGERPVALALGPTAPSGESDPWISVVLDDVVGEVGGTAEVMEEWKVIKRSEPGL